jgi:uncharacterized protein with von Willebrand factor type A (vWA) domain
LTRVFAERKDEGCAERKRIPGRRAMLERRARCAHTLAWLNPLKARPEYEPLTRRMQAALTHVDRFLAGSSLASLEELAGLMKAELA